MSRLMRCKYCGTLQDEPQGPKICLQCGGELVFVADDPWIEGGQSSGRGGKAYVKAQLELDQIAAPADRIAERHLLITVETPDVLPATERARESGREPLRFVAVLDVSGSMRGDKIEAAKEAVRQAVQRLQNAEGGQGGDAFSLVVFSTDARCLVPTTTVDAELRRVVDSVLEELDAGGQTALCGGLELGIEQMLGAPQGTNLVLLLSDGQANVGETDVEAVGRRALDGRSKGITVSTLGVGRDYNEALMTEIAIDGGGRFYHINKARKIAAYLTGELGEMASLAARRASVSLYLPDGAELQTLSAAYPVRGHEVTLGDIPISTTLEVVCRVLLPPQPSGTRQPIEGVLRYESPAGNVWSTRLNTVTVRYVAGPQWVSGAGVVRPLVRRVLGHMQAASVLATTKAATRGSGEAQRKRETELAAMGKYAALLGQDPEVAEELAESERVLRAVAAPSVGTSGLAKQAAHSAMRRHRGSKDFDGV